MLSPEEHLERMSGILRRQIGPAVADPFARTQAFMASVVLEKLARQLAGAAARAEADRLDVAALRAELAAGLSPDDPAEVARAVHALDGAAAGGPTGPALSAVVAALWAARPELDPQRFDHLLGRVRTTLRARLDRQLEYSS